MSVSGELDWKGRRSGQGSMFWTGEEAGEEAVIYCGGWERDRMEGEGVMWWADSGNTYSGQWSGGKMNGRANITLGGETSQASFR